MWWTRITPSCSSSWLKHWPESLHTDFNFYQCFHLFLPTLVPNMPSDLSAKLILVAVRGHICYLPDSGLRTWGDWLVSEVGWLCVWVKRYLQCVRDSWVCFLKGWKVCWSAITAAEHDAFRHFNEQWWSIPVFTRLVFVADTPQELCTALLESSTVSARDWKSDFRSSKWRDCMWAPSVQ